MWYRKLNDPSASITDPWDVALRPLRVPLHVTINCFGETVRPVGLIAHVKPPRELRLLSVDCALVGIVPL